MSWWQKLFGTAERVADEVHFSGEEKAEADHRETDSARRFAAPGQGGQGVFNDLVDACNRMPRPFITAWLVGGFMGWWKLPDPGQFDPFWHSIFFLVLTFWFGGRVLLKDLPKGIGALIALHHKFKKAKR